MIRAILSARRRTTLQQCVLWMLLLSVTYALTGIAYLPTISVSTKDLSERFPCEACACGCSSAKHCWDKCCCHSDREKLDWAEKNGVQPPEFLVKRATGEACTETVSATKLAIASLSNAANQSVPSCCAQRSGSADNNPTASQLAQKATHKADTTRAGKFVLMWKAAECRGLKHLWNSLGETCVPPTVVIGTVQLFLMYWLIVMDESAKSCIHSPEPPIP